MNKSTAFLLREGYALARLYDETKNSEQAKDSIVTIDESGTQTEYCVTSTRITLIGRELPGGALHDEYGIICGEDLRSNIYENTLGGGRMEPYTGEYREEGDAPAGESVIECLLREVEEELKLLLNTEEIMLIGMRSITEDKSSALKMIDGKTCVDAYFLGFIDERLPVLRAHNGETGDRRVLRPEELLLQGSRGPLGKRTLPETQRLAVATTIITLRDLFGNSLPKPVNDLIERNLPLAREVYQHSRWARNFTPLIRQS